MRHACAEPKPPTRKQPAAGARSIRYWAVIGAELSPYLVTSVSLVGLLLVADYVPDGAAADRFNWGLYVVGALGFCGAGVGWLLSGYRIPGVSIWVLRTIFAAVGAGIVALSFTVLCSNPCDETFSSDVPGPVMTLALLLCAGSAAVPLISAIALAAVLRGKRA